MNAEDRRKYILEKLNVQESISISDICGELSMSLPTVRNDFDVLEKSGKIIRTFGGAILNRQNLGTETHDSTPKLMTYTNRTSRFHENKVKIGNLASTLVSDFDIVFLDAGTTVFEILDGIISRKIEKLVVLTNSIYVGTYLMNVPDIIHYVMGGSINSFSMATIGYKTIDEIKQNHVNKVFLGADGLAADGFTVQDINEAMIKRAMIDIAAEKYLLVDSSKIKNPTFIEVAKFDVLNAVITENGIFHINKDNMEESIAAINRQKV